MRPAIYMLILPALILAAAPVFASQEVSATEEPEIIERTIKIEGTIEKPRVIFIIPRAKFWREDLSKKSFATDILRPVYPENLISPNRR